MYRVPSFWLAPAPNATQEELMRACPVTEHIAANGIWIHHRALLGARDDTLAVAEALHKVIDAIDVL